MGNGGLFQFCIKVRITAHRRFDVEETLLQDNGSTQNCRL